MERRIKILKSKDASQLLAISEEVQNLHFNFFPELFKPFENDSMRKALSGMLADPNCMCFVALDGEKAVGYILIYLRSVAENAFHRAFRIVYIDQIGVSSNYRRVGIASKLLNQAELFAREQGAVQLELDHWAANTVAAESFRKCGFKELKNRLVKKV